MKAGINDKNREILDSLHMGFQGPFSVKEASKLLNFSEHDTRLLLAYLARKEWLSRVRTGLYSTVPMGTIKPHDFKENPFKVVKQVFFPGYIGGWSAAEHWNFTDQIFSSMVVFTVNRFRSKNMNIQGTDYVLKYINDKTFGKTKTVWIENEKIQFSDPWQTIADILDDPYIGGGIRHVADILINYFDSENVNTTNLLEAVKSKKNRAVFKRLGYLIEKLNLGNEELLNRCKENLSSGYSPLDPSVKKSGKHSSAWKLIINVDVRI